ncbi:hypothetical protein MTO96_015163 [Rhipicephalus appendiculatus]
MNWAPMWFYAKISVWTTIIAVLTYGLFKLFNFYNGDVPTLVIKDIEFLTYIFVKNFQDFTSRGMIPYMSHVADVFVQILGEKADAGKEYPMLRLFQGLTMDYVGRAAFGFDCTFQRELTHPFLKTAQGVLPGVMTGPFHMFAHSTTTLAKYIAPILWLNEKLGTFSYDVFNKHTTKVIQLRMKNPEARKPDMLQTMLDVESEEGELPESPQLLDADAKLYKRMSPEEVGINTTILFIAGQRPPRPQHWTPKPSDAAPDAAAAAAGTPADMEIEVDGVEISLEEWTDDSWTPPQGFRAQAKRHQALKQQAQLKDAQASKAPQNRSLESRLSKASQNLHQSTPQPQPAAAAKRKATTSTETLRSEEDTTARIIQTVNSSVAEALRTTVHATVADAVRAAVTEAFATVDSRLTNMETRLANMETTGELDYTAVAQGLKYLARVVDETLRMFPPVVTFTTRSAINDFEYNGIKFKAGTSILSPTIQIHMDPRIWPDPEKFDPDRFLPENVACKANDRVPAIRRRSEETASESA